MSACQMHLSSMKGHRYGPGINGRDLEQLATCCACSVTLQGPALFPQPHEQTKTKKCNHIAETFYFPCWACQLTLSGAGNPQWVHQQTGSCRGGVLEEGSDPRDPITSPQPWKSWAVVQGQWEPVCRPLHASETAAGQTEMLSTSSWWDSVSSLSAAVCLSLHKPLFLLILILQLCNLCWLCNMFFGGVEGAGRRRRQQTLSPLPKLPVCS